MFTVYSVPEKKKEKKKKMIQGLKQLGKDIFVKFWGNYLNLEQSELK